MGPAEMDAIAGWFDEVISGHRARATRTP